MELKMTKFKSNFLRECEARGFLNQCTNFDALDEQLCSGVPVVAYWGTDPTANSLHVGHIFSLMIMRLFQKHGNKPILLIGGSTALIGDPSGRDTSRPMMSKETLDFNKEGIKTSMSKFITFGNKTNDAILVDNYDWCGNLNWIEVLRDIGPHISVNKMLTMDSVRIRLEKEEHLSFLEFNYMIMQAYDFYYLYKKHNCTLQLCGADQWGNAIAGVDLIRRLQFINNETKTEAITLSTPLLTDANGKKVGKTAGNAIWVNNDKLDSYDYFQYFRNTDDKDVIRFLKIYTDLELNEIDKLSKDNDINSLKKILAFEATKICRGEPEAKKALKQAEDIFEGNSMDSLPILEYKNDETLLFQVIKNLQLSDSYGDAKKLIRGGGVKINDNGADENQDVKAMKEFKLSVGKKKHFLVKII